MMNFQGDPALNMLPQFQELRILMEAMDPDFIAYLDANDCGNLIFCFRHPQDQRVFSIGSLSLNLFPILFISIHLD
jgi:hypothetical protein